MFRSIKGGCDKYDRCNYCNFQSEKDNCENSLIMEQQAYDRDNQYNNQNNNQQNKPIYQSKKHPNMNEYYKKYNIQ